MTSEDNNSLSRRHFIVSASAIASTIGLAGCSSNDSDLPPPNYDENPGGDGEESDEQDNGDSNDSDSLLSPEDEQFLSLYTSAHIKTENGINYLVSAVDKFNNRDFEEAVSAIVDAQIELSEAREIVVRDDSAQIQDKEIWSLSKDIDDKTDMDIKDILEDLERAITTAMEGTRIARDANTDRENGDVDSYESKKNTAQLKANDAQFDLPQDPSELRQSYKSDLGDN